MKAYGRPAMEWMASIQAERRVFGWSHAFDSVMCRPIYFNFASQITSVCPPHIQKVLGYFMEDDFFFFCLKLALVAFMCYPSYDRHVYKKSK